MNGFIVLFVPLFLVGTMTVSCWEIASARASVPAEGTIIVDSNIPSPRGWHRGIDPFKQVEHIFQLQMYLNQLEVILSCLKLENS